MAPGALASARRRYSGRTPSLTGPASASLAAIASGTPSTRRWPTLSPPPSRHCAAGRKFMPGEPMKWPTKVVPGPLEQLARGADLHRAAARHDHHLVGEGQRLDLVVRDVDQRELELVVDLLELAAQLPLQMRVDDGQRLVEEHGRHVLAHQAAAQRDLLLGVGRQAAGAALQHVRQLQHLGDAAHAFPDLLGRHAAVAQRERQVLGHGHRVVDDRELEHLRDVALLRRERGHVAAVEQDACRARAAAAPTRCSASWSCRSPRAPAARRRRRPRSSSSAAAARSPRPPGGWADVGVGEVQLDVGHQAIPPLAWGRAGAASKAPSAPKA